MNLYYDQFSVIISRLRRAGSSQAGLGTRQRSWRRLRGRNSALTSPGLRLNERLETHNCSEIRFTMFFPSFPQVVLSGTLKQRGGGIRTAWVTGPRTRWQQLSSVTICTVTPTSNKTATRDPTPSHLSLLSCWILLLTPSVVDGSVSV